ncbi:MAG: DUF2760 domain-containing protein [Anaeromyxobacter sp.]
MQRLALAFYALFAVLFRADFAAAVARAKEAHQAGALPPPGPAGAPQAGRTTVEPAWTATPSGGAVAPPRKADAGPGPGHVSAPPATPTPMAPAPATVRPERSEPAGLAESKGEGRTAPARAEPARPDTRSALQLLAVLQREGRLVDFIEEDLTGFPDASIGAAARTVHAGCKKAIQELFALEPVYREAEGAQVTVAPGFDASAVRLTGNVVGKPPFKGALRHHGWRVKDVKLPAAPDGQDARIVAPAEVEL